MDVQGFPAPGHFAATPSTPAVDAGRLQLPGDVAVGDVTVSFGDRARAILPEIAGRSTGSRLIWWPMTMT